MRTAKNPSRNYKKIINPAEKILLLTILILVVALSGCSVAPAATVQYKNDVITIEDYYVSTINPYVESTTTLEFLLQNNGEKPVPYVEVNFFNIPGFNVTSLRCQDTQPINSTPFKYDTCIFNASNVYGELEPFDVRKVSLILQTPSRGVIKTPTTLTIGYSINYSYSGFRKADIPVVDGVTVTRAVSKFSQSTPAYGPIHMSFEPPVGATRVEEGRKIDEYWGVQGTPFGVKMNFAHTGTGAGGTVSSVAIEPGHVMLDLKGSLAKVEGMTCNFESDALGFLYSKKRIKLPDTLMCNFKTTDPNLPPETIATIWAQFDYTYKFTRSETFEVRPFQE